MSNEIPYQFLSEEQKHYLNNLEILIEGYKKNNIQIPHNIIKEYNDLVLRDNLDYFEENKQKEFIDSSPKVDPQLDQNLDKTMLSSPKCQ